jgi:hypothetical protein
MKVKLGADISLILSKLPHPTDESQSIVHTASQQMHCGEIWNLTQLYLEQKLAIDVLLHHLPNSSPRKK